MLPRTFGTTTPPTVSPVPEGRTADTGDNASTKLLGPGGLAQVGFKDKELQNRIGADEEVGPMFLKKIIVDQDQLFPTSKNKDSHVAVEVL